ncbi:MAG: hypothetical protein Pars92KO_24000 [Parasphingorhabdus sp.]
MKEQSYCNAPEGLEQIEQRLIKLEMLLVEGLSRDISTYLSTYIRRLRKMRSKVLPANLFSDAAWDILLELRHAQRMDIQLSITVLAELVDIPQSLLDRYMHILREDCLLSFEDGTRTDHSGYVKLTCKGIKAMDQLFDNFVATVNDDLENARLARRTDLAA